MSATVWLVCTIMCKLITNVLCLSGIHLTQEIVDAPANEMHTDSFLEVQIFKCSVLLPIYGNATVSSTTVSCLQKIKEVGQKLGIQPEITQGTDLRDKGFGGMWTVTGGCGHNMMPLAWYPCPPLSSLPPPSPSPPLSLHSNTSPSLSLSQASMESVRLLCTLQLWLSSATHLQQQRRRSAG